MSIYPSSIPRCEHLKINGTQCGSPALRRNHFCFFHKRWHETRIVLNANRARRARVALDLPVLEDADSVQVSLMQVMRLILNGHLDTKTAGLLLYALQTASANLSRINFEPAVKTRVVIDPRTVGETPLGENPWRREDFEEEEYEEDDQQVAAKPVDVGIDKEWTAEVPIPSIEAQAEPGQERNQTIAQIQAAATTASRPPSSRSSGRFDRAAALQRLAQASAPPMKRMPHRLLRPLQLPALHGPSPGKSIKNRHASQNHQASHGRIP
jgi:hypothetical protein